MLLSGHNDSSGWSTASRVDLADIVFTVYIIDRVHQEEAANGGNMTTSRRAFLMTMTGAASAAVLPRVALGQQDDWPKQPITMVTPFDPGGSNDRFARVLAPQLAKELGQPVVVLNKPGGNTLVGHNYFMQQPADGYTLLSTSASIYIAANILFQNAAFKISDFAFINTPWRDITMLVTSKNKPYADFKSFIEEIRKRPGQISIGGIPRSADQLNLMLMLNALKIPRNEIRFVNYNGGGPLRTDVAAGHIDAIVAGAEGNEAVIDLIRPLVAFDEHRIPPWDAPSIVEAAQSAYNVTPEFTSGSIRGFGAHAAFRSQYPARWQKLVAAFERATKNPEVQEALKKQAMPGTWLGPEQSDKIVLQSFEILSKHKDLLS
jgi:putative tricarboxylic transport membrane protein